MEKKHDASITGPLDERRRDTRHAACLPAIVQPMFDQRQTCVSYDLSRTGGRFLIPRTLEPGDQVTLELQVGDPEDAPHRTGARVVWVRRREAGEAWRYDAAMEFDHPSVLVEIFARSQAGSAGR